MKKCWVVFEDFYETQNKRHCDGAPLALAIGATEAICQVE
jgi:hypothetical protein